MKNNLYNGLSERLYYTLGKRAVSASAHDIYMALCYAVRDQMMSYWLNNQQSNEKEVAYLSAEFLIGPQLNNNLLNLGIKKEAEEARKNLDATEQRIFKMKSIKCEEPEDKSIVDYFYQNRI